MKCCTKCKKTKPLELFGKDKHKKSGYTSRCKECMAEDARKYRASDVEKSRSIAKKYRERNLDKERTRYNRYNKENPEVRAHHAALRRAKTKKATPAWLTKAQEGDIKKMYALAKKFEELCNIRYHVDHIVPLAGKDICGLHVPWNLQILPASVNLAKSNNY
jgi:hypothetical protein